MSFLGFFFRNVSSARNSSYRITHTYSFGQKKKSDPSENIILIKKVQFHYLNYNIFFKILLECPVYASSKNDNGLVPFIKRNMAHNDSC